MGLPSDMQLSRNIGQEVYTNVGFLFIAIISGLLMAKLGIIYAAVLVLLPSLAYGGYLIFTNITFGLMTLISISLFLPLDRYVKIPLGLSIDAVLFIIFFGSLLKTKRSEIRLLNYPVFYISGIWFLYCCLEFFNPEAVNRTAWIYACRNLTLHFLLTVTVVLLKFNKEKHLRIFINVWLIGSLAGAAYAFKQYFIGLNSIEYAWVMSGKTHLIKGVIRIFSFYTDAGIFGATMAFTGLCTLIFSIGEPKLKLKIYYLVTSGVTFYAMSLSGTRGAMFVPIVGLLVYMTLVKQIKLLIPTLIILGTTFYILKYTDIGESSFQVSRMRSALNPTQDESFMVRINNQRRLTEYMSSRPFGGGIGSMGFWGKRFSPETFLANTPPDSWYVWIWGETGIVGVSLYILLLLILLSWSMFTILKIRDPLLRNKMLGLFCGTCGIVVASYGNPLLGQIPCNFYIYICFCFFFLSAKWDKEKSINLPLGEKNIANP